jgi:hypothetical protein
MALMFPSCYRHPRGSGGPELALAMNRGRPVEPWGSGFPLNAGNSLDAGDFSPQKCH